MAILCERTVVQNTSRRGAATQKPDLHDVSTAKQGGNMG